MRRLLGEPELRGIGAVILDEFHERHLAADLLLVLLDRLSRTARPDLKLVVMSATLDAEPSLATWALPAHSQRRAHVSGNYQSSCPKPTTGRSKNQIVSAVRRAVTEETTGDILVFLPGSAEIRKAKTALEPLAQGKSCWCCRCTRSADRRAGALSSQRKRAR